MTDNFSQSRVDELFKTLPLSYKKPIIYGYKGVYAIIVNNEDKNKGDFYKDRNLYLPIDLRRLKLKITKLEKNSGLDKLSWREIREDSELEWDVNRIWIDGEYIGTKNPEIVWAVGYLVFQAIKKFLQINFPKQKFVLYLLLNTMESDDNFPYSSVIRFQSIKKNRSWFALPRDSYYTSCEDKWKIEYVNDDYSELEGLV